MKIITQYYFLINFYYFLVKSRDARVGLLRIFWGAICAIFCRLESGFCLRRNSQNRDLGLNRPAMRGFDLEIKWRENYQAITKQMTRG